MPKITRRQPPPEPTCLWTFLQFVLEELLGPPNKCDDDGSAKWECPRCGESLLNTKPHKPPYPDRWCCWKCSPDPRVSTFHRGDAMDALKYLSTDREVQSDYEVRRRCCESLRLDYEKQYPNGTRPLPSQSPRYFYQQQAPDPVPSEASDANAISPRGAGSSNTPRMYGIRKSANKCLELVGELMGAISVHENHDALLDIVSKLEEELNRLKAK